MYWYTCTCTSEELAASILRAVKKGLQERRKLNAALKCGTYVHTYSVKRQKSVTFKNNLLFYNTLLINNAVY